MKTESNQMYYEKQFRPEWLYFRRNFWFKTLPNCDDALGMNKWRYSVSAKENLFKRNQHFIDENRCDDINQIITNSCSLKIFRSAENSQNLLISLEFLKSRRVLLGFRNNYCVTATRHPRGVMNWRRLSITFSLLISSRDTKQWTSEFHVTRCHPPF